MSRSVALSPQFGNTLTFSPRTGGRRRLAKPVHVPVPEGLRVVAVCVPDDVEQATRPRARRSVPHRSSLSTRRAGAAPRVRPVRGAEPGGLADGFDTGGLPAAPVARRARPARPLAPSGAPRGVGAVRPVAVPRSVAPARNSQQAKLRLTRRGQIVVTLLVTGLLLAVFSLGRFSAGAAGDPVPHRIVVVHSGDTLWSIASKAAPAADPRVTVEKIRLLNHLDGGAVQVGESLKLP